MEKLKKKIEDMTREELVLEVKRLSKEIDKRMSYGLVWEDKPEFVKINDQFEELFTVIAKYFPVLDPDMSLSHISSKNATNNLLIECENYFGLLALIGQFKNINDLDETGFELTYLDPPYNTGNQDFFYNDSYVDKNDQYPHSKWLSFMYKRLLLARFLLKRKGLVVIQIDDRELFNLKLLCDRVFGEDNFINNISVKMSELAGVKMAQVSRGNKFPKVKESLILFAKDKSQLEVTLPKIPKENWDNEYNQFMTGLSMNDRLFLKQYEGESVDDDILKKCDKILEKVNFVGVTKAWKDLGSNGSIEEFQKENAWRICRTIASKTIHERAIEKRKDLKQKFFSIKTKRDGQFYVIKSDFDSKTPNPRVGIYFADSNLDQYVSDIWMDIKTTGLSGEVPSHIPPFKNGQKPIKLMQRLINLFQGNVSVLDFFGGSGSTAHAGMELASLTNKSIKNVILTNNDIPTESNYDFLIDTLNLSDDEIVKILSESGIKINKKSLKLNLEDLKVIFKSKGKKIQIDDYDKLGICRKFTQPRLFHVAKENNQNLLYYRIKMIERGNSTKQLKRNLKKHLTEMVKVKEDLNEENRIKINNFNKKNELEAFVDKNNCLIVVIYDIFINITKLKAELKDYDNVKLYVYSTEGVELEEFNKLASKKVEVIDALDEILKVYRQLD